MSQQQQPKVAFVRFIHSVSFEGELDSASCDTGGPKGLASSGHRGFDIQMTQVGGAPGVLLSRGSKRAFVPATNLRCVVFEDMAAPAKVA